MQNYLKQLDDESAGSQGMHRMDVKKEESSERKRVKTEERNGPAARSRYFWLGGGADSDPRIHGVFPDRTYSDWESLESSDEVSESSETSSDSDVLEELRRMDREFPALRAEADIAMMEEDRKRGGRSIKKITKTYFLQDGMESPCKERT